MEIKEALVERSISFTPRKILACKIRFFLLKQKLRTVRTTSKDQQMQYHY